MSIRLVTYDDSNSVGARLPALVYDEMQNQSATILFIGDYETGTTGQFGVIETAGGASDPTAVTSSPTPRAGSYCGKYALSGSQARCESVPAYTGQPYIGKEGRTLSYSWSVFYPSGFPTSNWQVTTQWHQDVGGTHDDPPIAIGTMNSWVDDSGGGDPWQMDPTHLYLIGGDTDGDYIKEWAIDLGAVPVDTWTDFKVDITWSVTAADCRIEVWKNGVSVQSYVPPTPLLDPTSPLGETYFKVGYYRDSGISTSTYVAYDEVKISRPSAAGDGGSTVALALLKTKGTSTDSVANTNADLTWATPEISTGSDFSVSGSDITVNTAGTYMISCSATAYNTNRLQLDLRLYLDTGSGYTLLSDETTSNYNTRDANQNLGTTQINTMLELSAGDKIKFNADGTQDGGASALRTAGTVLTMWALVA